MERSKTAAVCRPMAVFHFTENAPITVIQKTNKLKSN
jgi:hypothetical protein